MDVAQFNIADDMVGVMRLRHPSTLEELPGPIEFKLLHIESPAYRERARERAAKRMVKLNVFASNDLLTLDEAKRRLLEQETVQLEIAAVAVVGISNLEHHGKVIDGTKYDAIMDLLRQEPWIYAQIQIFLGQRANFMRPSAEN